MSETRGTWPYPGDGPIARARRVAHAYRAALLEADPNACDELDTRMRVFGQTWAVPRVITHEPDEWLPVADAADVAAVDVPTLRQWRRRGLLEGRRIDGVWHYRPDEIIALSADPRVRRARRSADGQED